MQSSILETGISIVYEPENCSPVVDIVIVHGLQGHPYKTWACTKVPKTPTSPAHSQPDTSGDSKTKQKNFGRFSISWRKRDFSGKTVPDVNSKIGFDKSGEGTSGKFPSVFWPADLLPKQCPNSRILMYGYDTKITKYMVGATNKNSVFSHSKDLLFALGRERTLDRPLIFVAHSLGGIVVKESLARSSDSTNTKLRNVVDSTAAVIFLGTPHRGSPDLSALGEWARSIVNTLRMDTASTALDTLGLKTTDLERTQEAFSGLWQKYDFRVKTFQEGLGLTGVNLGVLGNKVVPDYSSCIGDHREQAETIQANHMEMCRFTGFDDPNYRKVAGELQSIYRSILHLNVHNVHKEGKQLHESTSEPASAERKPEKASENEYTEAEKSCLQSLWFPNINNGHQSLALPAEQTCLWLFEHKTYQDWFDSQNLEKHCGLLRLKGKPGAGKSILMKEAFRRAALGQSESNYWTAAFFFSAKGDELEHAPVGLLRSLLYQLLPRCRKHLQSLTKIWSEKNRSRGENDEEAPTWREVELRSFLQSVFADRATKRMLIFIDALDECDSNSIRSQAYFWREITKSAYAAKVHLNVCLTSRHFPSITISDCLEIVVEDHNSHDIAIYVEQKFQLGIAAQEPDWKVLRDKVLSKSAGIFLWVALVMDDVLTKWDDGNGLKYLLKQLDMVPEELEALFSQMFLSLDAKTRQLTLRFFHWAILAAKPLRLHEWHHILAFIQQPALLSLRAWRMSDEFTKTDDQLERKIKSISKGLVEVKTIIEESQGESLETASVRAGAGSLDLEHGETRVIQVIHESVREFFLQSKGFSILYPSFEKHPIGKGHLSIMATCLDYLNIAELNALVMARSQPNQHDPSTSSIDSATSGGFTDNKKSGVLSDPTLPFISDLRTRKAESYVPMSSSPPKRRMSAEQISTFTILRESFTLTPAINIAQWIATNQLVAGRISLNRSTCNSLTHLSVTGQSQVLEDYPALLSYATLELFTHARLAEKEDADPDPIIGWLEEKNSWDRWIALREDIPQGTKLLDYVASLGLRTWVSNICRYSDATRHSAEQSRENFRKHVNQYESKHKVPRKQSRENFREQVSRYESKYKAPRRGSSVASFSSAGSHI